uniref:Histone-lysine N-methyltransferase SETMAR n=1 Tax=Caenorhabditis japonica TaxID=281687 RepID=A0A8R1I8G5_CAEJA
MNVYHATRQKLHILGIQVLLHPPYSPALAPTDYHLFRSLQNLLAEQKFHHRKAVEKRLDDFFSLLVSGVLCEWNRSSSFALARSHSH